MNSKNDFDGRRRQPGQGADFERLLVWEGSWFVVESFECILKYLLDKK